MIDYGFKIKSGMHEFLELASKRVCIFPAFRVRNTNIIKGSNTFLKLRISIFYYLILSNWKKQLNNVGTVVVTAHYWTVGIVQYLNKYYPDIKVHVYYFNIVEKDVPVEKFATLNCYLWSFDKADASKYGMKFIPTPTCFENFTNDYSTEIEYDVFFLGVDKGRLNKLLEIKSNFLNEGISAKYHIVKTIGDETKNDYPYLPVISYHEYLVRAKRAKALLEIKQEAQRGNTLRPVEAGLMKKKLITDDESIKNEPFYNKNNIYILNEKRSVYQFINCIPYDNSFDYDQYDIEKWLESFD